MINSVYELKSNIQRLSFLGSGDAYDIKAFDFSKAGELKNIYYNKILDVPTPVFFYMHSSPEYIKTLDNLVAPNLNCIYSRRMIDALLSIKEFKHHVYPVSVLEEGATRLQKDPNNFSRSDPYSKPDFYNEKSIRDDLFIFQTLEYLDIFDWEKSDYRQSDLDKQRKRLGHVNEYVLKEPDGGFPPLFRIVNDPVPLFISVDGREALKRAGIRGPAFLSLRGYRPDSQLMIDVPI